MTILHLTILHFASKAEAQRIIRQELAQHPADYPFSSELLQYLIWHYHPILAGTSDIPEYFLKSSFNPYGHPHPDSYFLEGYFPQKDRWYGVSWRDCIHPPTLKDRIRKCFRQYIRPQMDQYRAEYPQCAVCGHSAEEVDHDNIGGFEWLFQLAYGFNPVSLWNYYFQTHYDFWSDQKCLWIPPDEPSVRWMVKAHQDGTAHLQSLCKRCHQSVGRVRRLGKRS